eukprot:gene9949-biopygen11911
MTSLDTATRLARRLACPRNSSWKDSPYDEFETRHGRISHMTSLDIGGVIVLPVADGRRCPEKRQRQRPAGVRHVGVGKQLVGQRRQRRLALRGQRVQRRSRKRAHQRRLKLRRQRLQRRSRERARQRRRTLRRQRVQPRPRCRPAARAVVSAGDARCRRTPAEPGARGVRGLNRRHHDPPAVQGFSLSVGKAARGLASGHGTVARDHGVCQEFRANPAVSQSHGTASKARQELVCKGL